MTEQTVSRTARCGCGQLSVTVEGDAELIVLCNCTECQRRTGSAFGIGAYYEHDRVTRITGERKLFERSSDSGRPAKGYFCPVCGTTVYWQIEIWPDRYGIAAGCFGDPGFPQPQIAAWSATKHDWVALPDGCRAFEAQG